MRPTAVGGPMALAAHPRVVVHDRVEDGREQPPLSSGIPAEAVEDELGDGGIADQLRPAQDLEVPGDGGLREVENGLEIGHEERGRGEAVEDPEPGRFGDGEQQIRGGRRSGHIRANIYMAKRMGKGWVGGWAVGGGRRDGGTAGRRTKTYVIPSAARDLLEWGSIPAEKVPRSLRSLGMTYGGSRTLP